MIVRNAERRDAQGILEAHFSAVHETAAQDYGPEILAEWSRPVDEARVQAYLADSFPREQTVVAEIDGRIAGFGAIVAEARELRAVYVHADFGGQGVGAALLARLESLARNAGCAFLEMDSSVTAEGFYAARGFAVVARGEHVLSSGGRMACVRMRKGLGGVI